MMRGAPLTPALMTSVPNHNSRVASAINSALSRVGPQLAGALIFVAIAASFYAALATRAPGLNPASQSVRQQFAPLNRPVAGTPAAEVAAARDASTHAFHLAMLVGAGLLLAGAAVNAVGIRNPERAVEEAVPAPAAVQPPPSE